MDKKNYVDSSESRTYRKHPIGQRALAGLLCICLVLVSLPREYAGRVALAAQRQEITMFAELPEEARLQGVGIGTPLEGLELPGTLKVECRPMIDAGSISPSEAAQEGSQPEAAVIENITWVSQPEYDCETVGIYVFTPAFPEEYALAEGVELPKINVAVGKGGLSRESELEEGEGQNFAGKETEDEKESLNKLEEAQGEWQELYAAKATPGCGTISEDTTWESGALKNGVLVVEPGVTLTLNGGLVIEGTVTIRGGGTIVRGAERVSLNVSKGNTLKLEDVTLDGREVPTSSSMIYVYGSLTMDKGCKICNCTRLGERSLGGALEIHGGSAVFNDVLIENCSTEASGGAIYVSESNNVIINGGTYRNNKTTLYQMENGARGGGALFCVGSTVHINGAEFIGNSTVGKGGAISCSSDTKVYVSGGTFQGNSDSWEPYAGSGASCLTSVGSGVTFDLSGDVKFCGDGTDSGVDGVYLESKQAGPRYITISGTLGSPVTLYLKAKQNYVLAQGTSKYALQRGRDLSKIKFVDVGDSGKKWYAALNERWNYIYLTELDPQYDYYVRYNSNGANGVVEDNNAYKSGVVAQVKPADGLEWEGKKFVGWNTNPDGSGKPYRPGDNLTIEGDVELYAIFEEEQKKTLTANFYSGDGCEVEERSVEVGESQADGKIEAPQPKGLAGFTFVGWEEENPTGYTGAIQPGQEVTLAKDETNFYAVYQKEVALSYVAEGAAQVPEGETKPYLANVHEEIGCQEPEFTIAQGPEREGFYFVSWNTQPDGTGIDYTGASKESFTEDTVLYARYSQKKALIASFYSGSTCGKETRAVEIGEAEDSGEIEAPGSKEMEGFTFVGWEEENPFGYTGAIQPGQGITLEKEETNFYAVYQKDVTLSYVAEGVEQVPESETKPYFANVHEEVGYQEPEFTIAQGPEREGYTFLGWNTNPDGNGDSYAEGSKEKFTEDTILYAGYTQGQVFAADFYSGGAGRKERVSKAVEDGSSSANIIAPALKEMDGWDPVGWDAQKESYAGDISLDSALTLTEPLQEYYGIYKKGVTLSYDLNGAEGVVGPDTQYRRANVHGEITYQGPEFAIASTPSRPGYIFQGWNTLPDGGGEDVPIESVQSYGEDTVLYAIWEEDGRAVPYQVEHYKQGLEGDGYTKADTEHLMGIKGREVEALQKEYTGFHFNNAHPSNVLSGKLEGDGGLVLEVYYDRDLYTVRFDLNGGYGAKPDAQEVRYGGLLAAVEEPKKAGYSFKGWHLGDNGLDGGLWDFGSPVEENTATLETTLYAKWADELAPQMGDASFSTERKDFLSWLIKKEGLVITVPVLEEGSGMEQAGYTLVPDQGEPEHGEAQVTEQHGLSSHAMAYGSGASMARALQGEAESGRYEAEITIDEDFKGKVLLTCTDNAGNTSPTKILTAMGGGVVVEDNAPAITFSNTRDRMSDGTADIDVLVEDSGNGEVSGGIAGVSYKIDQEGEVKLPEADFQGGIVESYPFTLNLSGEGKHTVQVYAKDNAGNESAQQVSLEIYVKKEKVSEQEERNSTDGSLEVGNFKRPQSPKTPGKPAQPGSPIGREPRTGGGVQVKIYATAAMVAGFGYLLLYFEGEHGITEEKKEEIVYRLIAWAKGGGTIRRYAGLLMISLFLAYYHSVGKCVDVEWEEVYRRKG